MAAKGDIAVTVKITETLTAVTTTNKRRDSMVHAKQEHPGGMGVGRRKKE